MKEARFPLVGLAASRALAVAPDDGALFVLGEEQGDPVEPSEEDDEESDEAEAPRGALLRLDEGGSQDVLLRGRPEGVALGCGAGFVVLIEQTEERYIFAASIFDRRTGEVTALDLGGESAVLLPCAALADGSLVVAGDRQLFLVQSAVSAPRPLLEGDVDSARISMGSDLVVAGDFLYWTTVGDTTAPSQVHRAPLAGGRAEVVVRASPSEGFRKLVVHGGELLVEWNKQDTRVGRVLEAELRSVSVSTGELRTKARLPPVALRALAVVDGVAWALPRSIGVDTDCVGLRAVDLQASDEAPVRVPEFLKGERASAMVADLRGLWLSTSGPCLVRGTELRPGMPP
jgi:hypothetical protein